MKIINHIPETDLWLTQPWDDEFKRLDNREAPIVRIGGDVFESHWDEDYYRYHSLIADPRRSFVECVWNKFSTDIGSVDAANVLRILIADLGIVYGAYRPDMLVAFHTMFPFPVAIWLASSMYRMTRLTRRNPEMLHVVNNPFFHTDAKSSDLKLVEIAQDDGCAYAVDMSVEMPSPETLAHEIALVNHIQDGEAVVATVERDLLRQIQEVL